MKYSIIIPVYNRPDEIDELLDCLTHQNCNDFEVIVVEDGSSEKCNLVVQKYSGRLDIKYFYKPNSGPGPSRNYGMEKAQGEFLIFFDSDCLIPPGYMEVLDKSLTLNGLDAFGGPEKPHGTFTDIQKAITCSMTSFITTGGIRGKKKRMDKFQARSFNMGFSREVYHKVGGFSNAKVGEDGDMSYRIQDAGFSIGLIEEAFVYHKRRISFKAFIRQVYRFGIGRIFLMKWYPARRKVVYFLPSAFLTGNLLLVILSLFVSWSFALLLLFPALLFFLDSLVQTKNLKIALLSILAGYIQLFGYGAGFLKGWWKIFVLREDERQAFKNLFYTDSAR